MSRKSCKSKKRSKRYSKRRIKNNLKKRVRKYSKKYSRRDGMNDNRLLSEPIPKDIDMFDYDEMDVEGKPFTIKKEDEYIDYRDYLEPLLNAPDSDSDIETISGEFLDKSSKPPEKMKWSFNRLYYNCPYCKESQYSKYNLAKHVTKVHNKPIYICEEPGCEYISARKFDFSRHRHKPKTNIKKGS